MSWYLQRRRDSKDYRKLARLNDIQKQLITLGIVFCNTRSPLCKQDGTGENPIKVSDVDRACFTFVGRITMS